MQLSMFDIQYTKGTLQNAIALSFLKFAGHLDRGNTIQQCFGYNGVILRTIKLKQKKLKIAL